MRTIVLYFTSIRDIAIVILKFVTIVTLASLFPVVAITSTFLGVSSAIVPCLQIVDVVLQGEYYYKQIVFVSTSGECKNA